MKFIYLLLCMMLIAACASKQQKADLSNVMVSSEGVSLISNHPEIINTYIKQQNVQSVYCLEPDPDIAAGFGSSLSLNASDEKSKATLSGSEQESLISTGGLSPMVLVIRELMYRACELSMNTNANQQQSIAIYQNFLNTIENISTVFGKQSGTVPSQSTEQ